MKDKTCVELKKVKNSVRNKAHPQEISCDKGKKSNFWKACENFEDISIAPRQRVNILKNILNILKYIKRILKYI